MCRPGSLPGADERRTTVTSGPQRTPTSADPAQRPAPVLQATLNIAGHPIGVRKLDVDDAPRVINTFQHLSPRSRRQRFLSAIRTYTPERVDALTSSTRPGRYAIVAVLLDHPQQPIVALAEYVTDPDAPHVAEPAITVADAYQGHRLGTRLWPLLLDTAHEHGITRLAGTLRADNTPARRLLQRSGARIRLHTPGVLHATLDLPVALTSPPLPSPTRPTRGPHRPVQPSPATPS
jgi:RimJ/RimL family protein N-acetyltransferase